MRGVSLEKMGGCASVFGERQQQQGNTKTGISRTSKDRDPAFMDAVRDEVNAYLFSTNDMFSSDGSRTSSEAENSYHQQSSSCQSDRTEVCDYTYRYSAKIAQESKHSNTVESKEMRPSLRELLNWNSFSIGSSRDGSSSDEASNSFSYFSNEMEVTSDENTDPQKQSYLKALRSCNSANEQRFMVE